MAQSDAMRHNAVHVEGAESSGLTLIPGWIYNYIGYKVWGEITYPFSNFNGCAIKVWECISDFNSYFTEYVITDQCWD